MRWKDAWLFLGCQTLQHGCLPRKRLRLQQESATTGRHFRDCLTFEVRGGLRLAARRPFDRGVRRMTPSNEMPGTQRHQRTGAAVRTRLGGTRAPEGLLHLGWPEPNRWATRTACIFTPDDRANQCLRGKGLRASKARLTGAWLFLGCQVLQHGRLPRKRLRLQQGSAATRRHFCSCLTFEVRGGLRLGARRPLD